MSYNNKRGTYYPSRYYSGGSGGNSSNPPLNVSANNDSQSPAGGRRESGVPQTSGSSDKYGGDYSNSYNNYYDSYRGSGSNSNPKYNRKYNKYNHNNNYSNPNKPPINRGNSYYNNSNVTRRKERYDSYPGKAYDSYDKRNYDKYEEYVNPNTEKQRPAFDGSDKDVEDPSKVDEMRTSVSTTGFRDERRGGASVSTSSTDFKNERRGLALQQGAKNEHPPQSDLERRNSSTSFHDKRTPSDYYDHRRRNSYDLRDEKRLPHTEVQYEEPSSNKNNKQYDKHYDNSQYRTSTVDEEEFNKQPQNHDYESMIEKELQLVVEERKRKEDSRKHDQKPRENVDEVDSRTLNCDNDKPSKFGGDNKATKMEMEEGSDRSTTLRSPSKTLMPAEKNEFKGEIEQPKSRSHSRSNSRSHSRSHSRSRSNSNSKARSMSRSRSNSNSNSNAKDEARPKIADIFNDDVRVSSSAKTDPEQKQKQIHENKINFSKRDKEVQTTGLNGREEIKSNIVPWKSDSKKDDHGENNEGGGDATEALTVSLEEISSLSSIHDNVPDPEFNFNNLVTIKENHNEETIAKDHVISKDEIPAGSPKNNKKTNDYDDNSAASSDNDEVGMSEAETVAADSPPRINKTKRLVRKKDYDINRHNLKKKRRIYSSEDEEMEDEDEEEEVEDEDEEIEHSTKGTEHTEEVQENSVVKAHLQRSPRKIKEKPYKIKRDSGGRSLLQRACKRGDIKLIKDYISRGADANEKDFGGFTCLHEAALEGHADVVQFLISQGANVNAKADAVGDSETPLIDAAENKHYATVKVLLDNGADPTIYNIDGFTALTKIFNEHSDDEEYQDIIKLLEDALAKVQNTKTSVLTKVKSNSGLNVSIVDDPTDTYFAELIKKKGIYKYAAEGSKELTANYFVSGNSIESKPDVLNLAARNGHVELVDIILGLNPNPYDLNTENACGVTVLLSSVGRGHYDVVESLLSKGADPLKTRNQDNLNSIQIAQGSVHYSQKEVDLLQKYAGKKVLGSTNNSKSNSRVASNVHSEVEDNQDKRMDGGSRKIYQASNNSDEESNENRTKPVLIKKRKSSSSEQGLLKKSKKSLSDLKLKSQTVTVTDKRIDSMDIEQPSRSSSPQPEKVKHMQQHSTSPSPGPVQAPLTKAQEEQKAKYAEEARIWQEKVEAKKRARREMFLKSEKEKERKKQVEEENRLAEEKRVAEELEKEKSRILKEAQEKSKVLEKKRDDLKYEFTRDSYPIGLKHFRFDEIKTMEQLRVFLPLYIFKINGIDYVIDLQIALIASRPIGQFGYDISKPIELSNVDKSKVWNLFYPMIGVDRKRPFQDMGNLYCDGHSKFQYLLLHFIRYDEATDWLSKEFPTYFKCIAENQLHNEVSLETLQPFVQPQPKTIINDDITDFVVDANSIEQARFVPPNLRRRKDSLRTIQNVSVPLW